jgi:arginyl-tRNA synthetase
MNGKDGKPFKTRDGGVMSLKSLMNLVYEETLKKINNESLVGEEKESVAKTVAMAALKYADLLPYRGTDYIFEVEKFSDLEGKTGPYLLYSTIRMKSLLNKAEEENFDVKVLENKTDREIAITLLNLPEVIDKAYEVKSLNDIADYLYKLTSVYNKFYAENRILTEEDQAKKDSWLTLTKIVKQTNEMLLDILGIEVPEKM